jgi:hypothetical protein
MRRAMFLLGLIAALTGTPLRQAATADDFAASLAELGRGDLVEAIDGGVGDDSGETIAAARVDFLAELAQPDAQLASYCTMAPRPVSLSQHAIDPIARPPAGFSRRHAWLQCFLF